MESKCCYVAVIGAGAAGLVAARELLREGHKVKVFEQNDRVGGIWNYQADVEDEDLLGRNPNRRRVHSSCYEDLRTNLPRQVMGYTDFPFMVDTMGDRCRDPRRYCHHTEVQAYLELFVEEFGLAPVIHLRTRVKSASPIWQAKDHQHGLHSGPAWLITTSIEAQPPSALREATDRANGIGSVQVTEVTEKFDALVSCVGCYHEPNLPDLLGMATFPGVQLHCHNYRNNRQFRRQCVVVVGGSFSGDEVACQVAAVAVHVYQSARTWVSSESVHTHRPNLQRVAMLKELHEDGSIELQDGTTISNIDTIIYCTGYRYVYPWLQAEGLICTDDMRVSPLYKHVFPPAAAPSLAFIGLLFKSIRFPQFELQAKWVSHVLSGRAQLPPQADMEEDVRCFDSRLAAAGLPVRYSHSHSSTMPEDQWAYNTALAGFCGTDVTGYEPWRRELHLAVMHLMFEHPETYRDKFPWTEAQQQALAKAEAACAVVLQRHRQWKVQQRLASAPGMQQDAAAAATISGAAGLCMQQDAAAEGM